MELKTEENPLAKEICYDVLKTSWEKDRPEASKKRFSRLLS